MPIDWATFIKNRSEIPPEALEKYMGQWIAWSTDGTHVAAASANSAEEVFQLLEEAGLDPSEHVMGYIDDMGTI
jgi:hypothetical protein